MAKGTSNWKYDAARDCYVDQATGFTATYESLISAKSDAEFEAWPSGAALGVSRAQRAHYLAQQQQMDAQQRYAAEYQRHLSQYGPHSGAIQRQSVTPLERPAPVEDEFGWLRRRVDEVCWKAA